MFKVLMKPSFPDRGDAKSHPSKTFQFLEDIIII